MRSGSLAATLCSSAIVSGALLTGPAQLAIGVGLLAPRTAAAVDAQRPGRGRGLPLTRCPGETALGSWTLSVASPAVEVTAPARLAV